MLRQRLVLILCLIGTAACSSPAASTDDGAPEPAAFDLALVRSNFTDECSDPIVVDEAFCDQVEISGMTADGDILNVPTGLNAASRDRGAALCEMLATAHFDGATGDPLGYEYVGILDMNGGNLAACTVD